MKNLRLILILSLLLCIRAVPTKADDYVDTGLEQSFTVVANTTGIGEDDIEFTSDVLPYDISNGGICTLTATLSGSSWLLTNQISKEGLGTSSDNLTADFVGGSERSLWIHKYKQSIYITRTNTDSLNITIEPIAPSSISNHANVFVNLYAYVGGQYKLVYQHLGIADIKKITYENNYSADEFKLEFGYEWYATSSAYRNVIWYYKTGGTSYSRDLFKFNIGYISSRDEEVGLLRSILSKITSIPADIYSKFSETLGELVDGITNIINNIKELPTTILNGLKNLFIPSDFSQIIKNAYSDIINSLGVLSFPLSFLTDTLSTVLSCDDDNFILGYPSFYLPFGNVAIIKANSINIKNLFNTPMFSYVGSDNNIFNNILGLLGLQYSITILSFIRIILQFCTSYLIVNLLFSKFLEFFNYNGGE